MTTAATSPNQRIGLAQGIAAYLMWGLLPLYFLALGRVPAGEVLADRIVFSLALLVLIAIAVGRWRGVLAALRNPRAIRLLALSAALISLNWLTYIWAVQHQHVLEASLGYFLNPLINVLLGVTILHERLTRLQLVAVVFAAAGVAVLASGAGGYLWITATLGVTFGLYGLVRKVAPVEAFEGLTIETALLTPLAVGYLAWLAWGGALVFGSGGGVSALLALGGVVTAVPLLLFASAARKLPYSVLGLLQYLAPTLQFVLAITVFGEALTWRHMICFALIWTGVAIFAVGTWRAGMRKIA